MMYVQKAGVGAGTVTLQLECERNSYRQSTFKKEVVLENEKKKIKEQKAFHGNQHVDCTPIGVDTKTNERKDTWTDSQTAKKAGVGVGTVARYNRVTILKSYSYYDII